MSGASLVALATAIAHGGVWAPPDRDTPAPGWEDDAPIPPAPGAPPPATTPAPAPTPAVAPAAAPAPPSQAKRRTGNGLLIGAGALAGVGLILSGARTYIVSGPCQEQGQPGCEESWGLVSPFAWVVNIASIGMAGAGAGLRGSYDAAANPDAQASRRVPFITAGTILLVAGFTTSVTLRSMWLADYSSPEGEEVFDFAKTGDALGYYGGLQLSSLAMAFGIAMLVHGTIRARRTAHRRGTIVASPGPMSLGLSGRF